MGWEEGSGLERERAGGVARGEDGWWCGVCAKEQWTAIGFDEPIPPNY